MNAMGGGNPGQFSVGIKVVGIPRREITSRRQWDGITATNGNLELFKIKNILANIEV